MRASVLIRTKNEQAALGATLDRVLAQALPPHEVVVIDSGSTDATLDVARRHPVTVLRIAPEDWGYARALNEAGAATTGDVLVSLSAHCLPTDLDWLGRLVAPFADPTVAGVWGLQLRPGRPVPPPGPPGRQEPGSYTFATRTWGLSNANGAVRRSLWEQFPFDEAMPATEDKAWGRRAMDEGYTIVYEPAAAVWHDRHTVANAYRRQRAVMDGYSLMFPEMGREVSSQAATVARAVARLVRHHASRRDPEALSRDLRRMPSAVAAVAGGFLARARRR